jgi:glycosyltransferase involved in cell wall biosynthesis
MKVLIAHPGKQHSYRTATALKQGKLLDAYVTTVYYKKNNLTSKIFHFLKEKDLNKAKLRRCENLDDCEVIQKHEFLGLIILLVMRLPFKRLCNLLNRLLILQFGKSIAKLAIKRQVDAVIMYDNTAVPCFSYLQKHAPHIKRILDASTVNRLYIRKVYEKDMEAGNHLIFKKQLPFLWKHSRNRLYEKEIKLSDFILVASEFVKKSYMYSHVPEEKLIKIPYGVDLSRFKWSMHKKQSDKIHLIYVGQITYYKGIHHLLPIIKEHYRDKVTLTLVGKYDVNDFLYKEYCTAPNIKFIGYVTNDKLSQYYQQADAFIIPSLGEGFGLVILEALSTGLPVLTSDSTGGNDAIVNGYNGYVFKAGDDKDMIDKIDTLIHNVSSLETMSENARATVLNYTWEQYNKHILNFINKLK